MRLAALLAVAFARRPFALEGIDCGLARSLVRVFGADPFELGAVARLVFLLDRRGIGKRRARRLEADSVHRLAEQHPVLRHVDGVRIRPDHLDVPLVEDAHLLQRQGRVQRGLAAHGRQQDQLLAGMLGALLLDDARHDIRRDRLDIGGVGKSGSVMIVAGLELTRTIR